MTWRLHRFKIAKTPDDCPSKLVEMNKVDLSKWLCKFIVEIRRNDGKPYIGTTLHQILCGLQRDLREEIDLTIDFFSDPEFRFLKSVLEKQLRSHGVGTKKRQAEPILASEEEILWERGLLGDKSPQSLLDTMVWMCGLYFALHSGQEHRSLRPGQIELVEVPGKTPFLRYYEDVSKNNPGGLNHRKVQPKSVVHYANSNPSQCFVRLYKLYCSKCPENRPDNATARKRFTDECWYSREPVGHNPLGSTVKRLCEKAGIVGFKTNHSLRVTAATRLFRSGVDEQIIMNVTGHRSIDGVRAYKRMSDEQHEEVSNILQVSNKKPRVMSDADTKAVVPWIPQQENVVPIPAVQQESVPAIPVTPAMQQENVSLEPVQSMQFGLPAMHIILLLIFTTGKHKTKLIYFYQICPFQNIKTKEICHF